MIALKICTKCNIEKSLECFSKAKGGKYGRKAECKVCSSLRFKKHYDENQDYMLEKTRNYRKSNPEKCKKAVEEYYCRNKESIRLKQSATKRRRYSENKEEISRKTEEWRKNNPEIVKRMKKEYRKNNPDKVAASSAEYRAKRKLACPKWLSKEDKIKISEFYKIRNQLTSEIGISHHVDHIVPLQHKEVCGLHVPWNLQILTAEENISKSNSFHTDWNEDELTLDHDCYGT